MKLWWLPPPFVPFISANSSGRVQRGVISMTMRSASSSGPSAAVAAAAHASPLPLERSVCLYGVEHGSPASSSQPSSAPSSALPLPFEITSQPMPAPKRNEVLVQVVAAGLNPADAKRVVGDKLPGSWTTLRSWFDRFYLHSKVPGFDFAGVVVQAPPDAADATTPSSSTATPKFQVGDRVFGMVPPFVGTLTNYLAAPVDQIAHVPPHLDWDRAAALPLVGVTVVQVLEPLRARGKSVLVLGASGGTGHVALQVSRAMGARRVVAVCGDANADFCRGCGATDVVSYQAGPQALLDRLLTGCGDACPFDVVLDCVTSDDPRDTRVHYPTLLQQSATAAVLLAPDYSYRRLGGPSMDWVRAGIERVTGWSGLWRSRHEKLFWIRLPNCSRELEQIAAWSGDNGTPKVEPSVSEAFEFTQEGVTAAMSAIMSRRVRGKVVVRIQSD